MREADLSWIYEPPFDDLLPASPRSGRPRVRIWHEAVEFVALHRSIQLESRKTPASAKDRGCSNYKVLSFHWYRRTQTFDPLKTFTRAHRPAVPRARAVAHLHVATSLMSALVRWIAL
jgi:hypothetical protein